MCACVALAGFDAEWWEQVGFAWFSDMRVPFRKGYVEERVVSSWTEVFGQPGDPGRLAVTFRQPAGNDCPRACGSCANKAGTDVVINGRV